MDDITFSGDKTQFSKITALLKYSKKIVKDENFALHPEKLRIMKRHQRQEVTGVIVNERPNINKQSLKRFRALIYKIEKDGIKGKTWNGGLNVLAEIDGYANFIFQIDKEKGKIYKEAHKAKFVKTEPKKESFIKKIFSFFKK